MKRHLLATTLVLLALPASAAASTGLVLSVDARHHTIQLVNAHRAVAAYHYRGKLPRLHAGSWISFSRSGQTISHVRSHRGSHRVSFKARVVKSGKHGLVLRLSDGKLVRFSAGQLTGGHRGHRRHLARAAASSPHVTLNIQGLQPGETVLVTESVDANGNIAITITLPSQGGGGAGGSEQDVTGTITQVSPGGLTINSPDQGTLTFVADDPDVTDGYQVGDEVDVSYSQEPGGVLDASDVEYVENDITGTVQSATPGTLTVAEDGSGTVVSFIADPADGVFDGITPGQNVDVTYHKAAAGLVADDVE